MSRYDYCYTISDERLGVDLVTQIECQVEATLEIVAGERRPVVSCVYLDDKNLFRGGDIAKAIAGEIANAAEAELLDEGSPLRQQFFALHVEAA